MSRPRRVELLLVVLVVASGAYFARAQYIPTWSDRHVAVASENYDIDFGSPPKWFSAWAVGDGQAFAVIAHDPSGEKLGMKVKEPGYRFARAGYSWLAATVSLGRDRLVPFGLGIVGAAALAGTVAAGWRIRRRIGPSAWLLIINPAIYLGFAGDTAEPLAALFLVVALMTSSPWAAIALGVTRPTYLIALLGRWRMLGTGIAAAALVGLSSLVRWGIDEMMVEGDLFTVPFTAYLANPTIAGWLLVAAAVVTLIVGVRQRDMAWVIGGLFVLCFGGDVTVNPANAWRAAGFLPVLWAFGPAATTPPPAPRVREETQLTPVDADVG